MALALTGWLLIIIAICLHFAGKSAGAFFLQERPGINGKMFRIIKFKTMTDEKDAEGQLLPDKQRLTTVGRFIRKTSIDELPQLINVLKGDMAFIGPRPLTPVYLRLFNQEQARRMEVRPGISGWAQVNGRSECKLSKKFEYDVWYVDHCTLSTDIRIFFKTIRNVIYRRDIGEGDSNMEDIDDLGFLPRIREMEKRGEIGSNFWIEPWSLNLSPSTISPSRFGCMGSDSVWMSTGRSAISFVLDTIERRNPDIKKIAVVPSFTCQTVIQPFIAHGYDVYTYHIGRDLMSKPENVFDAVKSRDAGLVLFHRYFGINTVKGMNPLMSELKRLDAITIEDCTQNLYSLYKKADTDYYVGSIRKWSGVPDGGFAVCKKGRFEDKPTVMDEALQNAKKDASIKKYRYLFEQLGEKSEYLNSYREAEDIIDNQKQYYTISDLSVLLQSNLDIDSLRTKRRENFKIIAEALRYVNGVEVVFNQLKGDEIPLYCPIVCEGREKLQSFLAKNSIYAPIIWPKADCCPAVDMDSEYLYEHLLCIPIDQRYDADDMRKVVRILKSYSS